jgi:hypothetical protein
MAPRYLSEERHVALGVRFGDGRLDLFWPYDLEEA